MLAHLGIFLSATFVPPIVKET